MKFRTSSKINRQRFYLLKYRLKDWKASLHKGISKSMAKVKEINLEYGCPTVDLAVRNMVSQLGTCKRQGYRAVILIHGYGSSGVGGTIKTAVRSKLKESSLSGIVRTCCDGEHWFEKKKELLRICQPLSDYQRKIDGNQGVTVVILK